MTGRGEPEPQFDTVRTSQRLNLNKYFYFTRVSVLLLEQRKCGLLPPLVNTWWFVEKHLRGQKISSLKPPDEGTKRLHTFTRGHSNTEVETKSAVNTVLRVNMAGLQSTSDPWGPPFMLEV